MSVSWCYKLQHAITNDSRWKASIPIASPLSSELNSLLSKSNSNLLQSNGITFQSNLQHTIQSPNPSFYNASICHDTNDDYNGITTVNSDISNTSSSHSSLSSISSSISTQSSYDQSVYFDIVDLLGNIQPNVSTFLSCVAAQNNYPKNSIFKFDGYYGLNDKNKLIDDIKASAFKYGTILTISKSNKKEKSNPNFNIVLGCAHFGDPKVSKIYKKDFLPNKLQQKNTIIQQPHSSTSIKNRSRSATNKLAHSGGKFALKSPEKTRRSNSRKCSCDFNISIIFHTETNSWYLKKKKIVSSDSDHQYHTNHIWIDPNHLSLSKNDLSPTMHDNINQLISSGTSIPTIQFIMKHQFNVNLDYSTLYNMRVTHIDNLLKSCSLDPQGSSVDKLISIFKQTKSVSFVYIKHRYNSGFVTYRKNRHNHTSEQITTYSDLESANLPSSTIQNWRDSITVGKANDVLVAFAWAHDEEIRATEKNPEFLAVDITFGVNRERRDLLLVAGIDGKKRVFTSFRCFIPSKQQHAYTWIMNEAFSHIISSETLRYNQCITCDQELSLNNSITSAVYSSKLSLSNSKMRLDCYHFFKKPWIENVVMKARNSSESKKCLRIMSNWILSWFCYTETQNEFNISFKLFKEYMNNCVNTVGDVASEEISILIDKIHGKQEYLMNHHFIDVCTFDFLGDSIVESANNPLKSGQFAVSSKMDLACSGHTQVKGTESKFEKEKVMIAKNFNSVKTWSNSSTKSYLTNYAEGIACDNFDSSSNYLKRSINSNQWLVCNKWYLCGECDDENDPSSSITKFHRVREVKITEDNYMICSCDYPLRWLIPCRHICCVIGDVTYYTADLFHIRYWKYFDYIFKKGNSIKDEQIRTNLENSLKYIRNNHFSDVNGKFKGIPLQGTPFLEHYSKNKETYKTENDKYYHIMVRMNKLRNDNKPIQYGTQFSKDIVNNFSDENCVTVNNNTSNDFCCINEFQSNYDSDCYHQEIDNNNCDGVMTMGAGSQCDSHLSKAREELTINASVNNDETYNKKRKIGNESDASSASFYSQLEPYFKDLVASIDNNEQLLAAINKLEQMTFQNFESRRSSATDTTRNVDGSTFLGDQCGRSAKERRHKFRYEK